MNDDSFKECINPVVFTNLKYVYILYQKSLFQLVAYKIEVFLEISLNKKTFKLYTSWNALKEPVQINYKKA